MISRSFLHPPCFFFAKKLRFFNIVLSATATAGAWQQTFHQLSDLPLQRLQRDIFGTSAASLSLGGEVGRDGPKNRTMDQSVVN